MRADAGRLESMQNPPAENAVQLRKNPGPLYNGMMMQQDKEHVENLDDVLRSKHSWCLSGPDSGVLVGWALVA